MASSTANPYWLLHVDARACVDSHTRRGLSLDYHADSLPWWWWRTRRALRKQADACYARASQWSRRSQDMLIEARLWDDLMREGIHDA